MESEQSAVYLSAVQQRNVRDSGVIFPLKQSEMQILVHVFICGRQECILHALPALAYL